LVKVRVVESGAGLVCSSYFFFLSLRQ